MTQESVLTRLRAGRLVVVGRRLEQQHVLSVAASLVSAGAPALELTLDEPTAFESIAELHKKWGGQLLIGGGTALQSIDAKKAIAAGVDFVVSPVFVPSVQRLCRQSNVLYIPGAATPTDIFRILKSGATAVKLFPASLMTPAYIKDVLEPFRNYQPDFMLTGGLGSDQIPGYLTAGVSILGIGKSILDLEALRTRQYALIGTRAQEILRIIHQNKK
jgi:2-dehydro-3-deoxyphosphogluconate aldolase/(4S)-4-hydroxy-2-oxoglutarate aldolase